MEYGGSYGKAENCSGVGSIRSLWLAADMPGDVGDAKSRRTMTMSPVISETCRYT